MKTKDKTIVLDLPTSYRLSSKEYFAALEHNNAIANRKGTEMTVTKTGYTCQGSVRGSCGHVHRTIRSYKRCCARDQRGCRAKAATLTATPATPTDRN